MGTGTMRLVRGFAGWTTAHGIPHIGSAKSIFLRVFWAIIVGICASFFIWQMIAVITRFLRYDVLVQTELKFEERNFPAITLCNLNPYNIEMINSSNAVEMNALLQDYAKRMSTDLRNSSGHIGKDLLQLNNITDYMSLSGTVTDYLTYYAALYNMDPKMKAQHKISGMKTETKSITFPRQDFIKSCSYNIKPCVTKRDIKAFFDPAYGTCFTFNSEKDPIRYTSTRAGPLYGLRLILITDQSKYLPTTHSAGIRLAIHSQGDEPFTDAFGFNAAVGFTTSFGLKYIKTERQPAPYKSNCRHVTTGVTPIHYFEGEYTQEGCFRSCYQDEITSDCGCMDPRLPIIPDWNHQKIQEIALNKSAGKIPNLNKTALWNATSDFETVKAEGFKFCNLSMQVQCKSRFKNDKNYARHYYGKCSEKQNCPLPCEESMFGVSVSTALWPSDEYNPTDCRTPNPPMWQNQSECVEWYRRNTMLIEIYYERMNYQLLSETSAYPIVNVISDTGGQIGLWLGVSVITVIEFSSLLVLLCLYWMSKDKQFYLDEWGAESDPEDTDDDEDSEAEEPETPKPDGFDHV